MRVPLSWLREYVALPADLSTEALAADLTALGLKLEALERPGFDMRGPLVLGRVITMQPKAQSNGKTINWCTVDVGSANGTGEPQGIVCGAHNFAPGDLVVVILPGGVLPGPLEISARTTYGHVSAGMICSERELGLGEDHDGIIVLPPDTGQPGEDAFELLHLRDEVIEFEINPDRAYALSLRGVAREVALACARRGLPAEFIDPAIREVPSANGAGYPVLVEDPEGCPVFVARQVSGFDPAAPSPGWLSRRLARAGMRPISLAVDVTNYVMLEFGRPIHAYDADRLAGALRVRRAHAGEYLTTLDSMRRELSAEDLVVADDSGIIGLGGVMGGQSTEISGNTTRILIEAAHWDAVSMFRSGRRHKLTSEAGKRNERGVDPAICEAAADRVVELLVRYGGGTVDPGVTKVGAAPPRRTVVMRADLPARVTGIDISADATVAHLTAVGCDVRVAEDDLVATVPSWRPDVADPFDLVEEVARIFGYDQVPSVLPTAPAGRGLSRAQRLRRRVGRTLAASGLTEVVSFPFIGPADLDALGLPAADLRRSVLFLANPLSSEEPAMTTTLLPGLLKAAARNVGRGASGVALYEVTTVTAADPGTQAPIFGVQRRPSAADLAVLEAAVPRQPHHLGVVVSGECHPAGWWGPGRVADWSDAVAAISSVASALGVDLEVRQGDIPPWHPGRCADLVAGGQLIGHAGELHPKVCAGYGVPARTAAAEVNLDALLAQAIDVVAAPSFSAFPIAKEDVALIVEDSVSAAEVERALRDGAGEMLESIRLFDVFTGAQLGTGKKSLAFALRFRAQDRTLQEGEAGAARDAAVASAVRRCGAAPRV
ncbi:MAG: phenylalanine--tRNA ligase subunit beta [Nocardioides sp.]